MSKYVKEIMMDQLRGELAGTRSLLIIDLKGLDAIAETQLRADLRKKQIRLKVLKNNLAGRVFEDMGLAGLRQFLAGPSVVAWGGAGVAELAKEVAAQVKKLKKPQIKGGAVEGTIINPSQVDDITKLPSREELIGRVAQLALSPVQRVISLANAPASGLLGQLEAIVEKGEAEVASEGDSTEAPPTSEGQEATEAAG